MRAADMGVRAYLAKGAPDEDLLPAIYAVAAGRSFLSAGVIRILLNGYVHRLRHRNTSDAQSLTNREKQILRLLADWHGIKVPLSWTCCPMPPTHIAAGSRGTSIDTGLPATPSNTTYLYRDIPVAGPRALGAVTDCRRRAPCNGSRVPAAIHRSSATRAGLVVEFADCRTTVFVPIEPPVARERHSDSDSVATR
jgi:hypothetical protein